MRFLKIYVRVIHQIQRNTIPLVRSSQRRCSVKKDVLRNFAKFTGKYQSLRPATVNKQESFLTYFWERNDNLFHGKTIGVMGQAAL